MTIKWVCNKCGKETRVKPPTKNSTCYFCRKGRFYAINKCVICGKEFKPNYLKAQCCSRKCRDKLVGRKLLGKVHIKKHPRRAKIRICPVCGKKFRAVKDITGKFGGKGTRRQKYCSWKCFAKRYRIVNYCRYCGKAIKTSIAENKQYCNARCRNLDYRRRFKGENSHLWEGGKTKKSKLRRTNAEYKEWRTAVFQRDNFTCQMCGSRRNIEAHHIKPQSEYPELIYDVNNGITLCHNCHKKTNSYGYKQRWKKKT